jgi:hypothetical protein
MTRAAASVPHRDGPVGRRDGAAALHLEEPALQIEIARPCAVAILPAGGCAASLDGAPASSPSVFPARENKNTGDSQLSLEFSNYPGVRDAGQPRNSRLARTADFRDAFKHRLSEALRKRVGPDREVRVKQLARLMGCSPQHVYNMLDKKVDPAGSFVGQLIDIFGPSFLFDLYGDIGGPMWRRRAARIEAQASAERHAATAQASLRVEADFFKTAAE